MNFVTVSLSTADKTYSQKFVANGFDMEDISMSHSNEKLEAMVKEAEKHFGEAPTKITVKATMEW